MPKFTGPLAEPIIRQDYIDHDYLGFPEAWREEIMGGVANRRREDAASRRAIAQENKRIEKLKAEKMLLLAEHYGARKNGRTDWCQLARHLADALDIVGFTVKSRPPNTGRPAGMKGRLYVEVNKLLQQDKPTVVDAVRALTRRGPPWDAYRGKETFLVTRYHEAARDRKTKQFQ